jgi:hypothetical protein
MMRAFSWSSHLSEQRLFECYLAERSGEGVDPRAAEHIADCPRCQGQYVNLVGVMHEVSTAADLETTAAFSPEFLRNQQRQIAERLELADHPRRVISFPTYPESTAASTKPVFGATVSRMAAGWIAAAAAAGLFVGAGAGFIYENRLHVQAAMPVAIVVPAEVAPAGPPVNHLEQVMEAESDEDSRLMLDMEAAHDRPRTQELLALDTLTPHIREISYRVR